MLKAPVNRKRVCDRELFSYCLNQSMCLGESTSMEQQSTTPTSTISITTTNAMNRSNSFCFIKCRRSSVNIFFFIIACYSPAIILIPGQSSLAFPLQYRRSQDFSISSTIDLNCDISLSITTDWTVKNCTSTFCSSEILLDRKVITTLSELYIPSRTLAYGTYELTLTVIMTDAPSLKSASIAYVRITATGVTANLVQLGTSMITRGSEQDLLLDPGTFSVDPDEDFFDATVCLNNLGKFFRSFCAL